MEGKGVEAAFGTHPGSLGRLLGGGRWAVGMAPGPGLCVALRLAFFPGVTPTPQTCELCLPGLCCLGVDCSAYLPGLLASALGDVQIGGWGDAMGGVRGQGERKAPLTSPS